MNEINTKDELNEININDEIKERAVRFGKALGKALESVLESIQDLEEILQPYQIYELLHPQKKPRGSIRRKRRRRKC